MTAKNKRKPLAQTLALLLQSADITYSYFDDPEFIPSAEEVVLLFLLQEALARHALAVFCIAREMKKRRRRKR